ncbi:MAG: hypothetical protein ACUVQP_12700, partial [Bacteroidales bacterium]
LVRITLLIFFILNFFVLSAQNDEEIIINHDYFRKKQVKHILLIVPINLSWLNSHPAFNQQLNVKKYKLKYDDKGNCIEASWTLCKWDSTLNQIDTTIQSLENYLYLKYDENKLIRIDAISFSEINFIEFKYTSQSVIQHIAYIENSQLKTKDDTVNLKPIAKEILNPYEWAIFPYYQLIFLDDIFVKNILINGIPFMYFDDNFIDKKIVLEAFPGLLIQIQ